MVCSCAMSSDCVYLQITFCSCVNETTRFSFLRSVLHENGRSLHFSQIFVKIQLGDRMVVNDYLSPPQRPLCIVGRLLCCGEAGEKEKESARGTRFLFLSIIDILMGIPSGSLCGGERTIIELGYHKILWLISLPLRNHDFPLNLVLSYYC